MKLSQITITDVRNLKQEALTPAAEINAIYGINGSGKTSLLEAINLLGTGRSFRTGMIRRVIRYEQPKMVVSGQVIMQDGYIIPVGIERTIFGEKKVKINHEPVNSLAALTRHLPMLLVTTNSFQLIAGGPRYRREYLDWGVFHVEHSFFSIWQRYMQCLKQRNCALKYRDKSQDPRWWDHDLSDLGQQIQNLREHYLGKLTSHLTALIGRFLPSFMVKYQLLTGWLKDQALFDVLSNTVNKDRELGYTQYGPHRADLSIQINKRPAHEVLSRGQQKLLVLAMRIAQAKLLREITGNQAIFLLDDVFAELDTQHRRYLRNELLSAGFQIFLTGISRESFAPLIRGDQDAMFHVKHGCVKKVLYKKHRAGV